MRILSALVVLACAQELPGAKPVPKDANWVKRHEGFVAEAKKGECDLLFLGDSITDGWRAKPKAIFDAAFGRYRPLNFGISGDRTQHVLWRIQNGEMEGIKPKAAVVMIGTNNIGQKDPEKAESAIEGVKAIVAEIHKRSAGTRVLLLGVFPRGEKPDHPHRAVIREINAALAKLDDGGKTVRFLEIGEKFLQPDGSIAKEIMPDFLHLSEKGYQIWADAIKEALASLMEA
ncbi:MAG TPA: platelet-activating factor acetylhydrolase IB subunit [Planctomycetota bacterium]|nr:platelet-activating factor acetylhydrolase IB subunit [Planctomycetota bacterium]